MQIVILATEQSSEFLRQIGPVHILVACTHAADHLSDDDIGIVIQRTKGAYQLIERRTPRNCDNRVDLKQRSQIKRSRHTESLQDILITQRVRDHDTRFAQCKTRAQPCLQLYRASKRRIDVDLYNPLPPRFVQKAGHRRA